MFKSQVLYISDFLFISADMFPCSKHAIFLRISSGTTLHLSLIIRIFHNERGTIIDIIIGVIATIKAIIAELCMALLASGSCFLNVSRNQNSKNRKSTVSFQRLSPPYTPSVFPSVCRSSRRKVSNRSFFFDE